MTDTPTHDTPADAFHARQLAEFEAAQRAANAYALYIIYNTSKEMIFAGHSRRLQTAFGAQRKWVREIATIKVVWFDTKEEAQTALDNLLAARVPRYNAHHVATYRRIDADGTPCADPKRGRVPKGYCPHCGRQKERPHAAYCNPCFAVYHRERKRRRAMKWDDASQSERLAATGRLDGKVMLDDYRSHLDPTPATPDTAAVTASHDPEDT